jgi:hypothetical protein
MARFSD